MISPTRYNLNLFIFFPLSFPWVRGGGDRLVKGDDGSRLQICSLIPIRCYKYPQYLCSHCFLSRRILIFSCLPSFTPPSACPQTRCQTILNQVASFYVYVHVPTLCFHWAAFHGRQGFLILGSRQRWQKQPGQSQSEPASHPAIQPVSRCSGAPAAPQRSPLYRRDIKPWIIYASPPLPSLLLPSHAAPNARPAACLSLSASLMNDYCIS